MGHPRLVGSAHRTGPSTGCLAVVLNSSAQLSSAAVPAWCGVVWCGVPLACLRLPACLPACRRIRFPLVGPDYRWPAD